MSPHVDLDQWVMIAEEAVTELDAEAIDADDHDHHAHRVDGAVDALTVARLDALRWQLLHVLDDDVDSLVPPLAGPLTQAEWNELEPDVQAGLQAAELAAVDPRLVPRTTGGSLLRPDRRR